MVMEEDIMSIITQKFDVEVLELLLHQQQYPCYRGDY